MDTKQLIAAVRKACDEATNWAVTGWEMRWGMNQVPVNTLAEAKAKPATFVNRQEALAYWSDIEEMGAECAACGTKALAALEKGDLGAAANAVYFAKFTEKKFNKQTPTWGSLSDTLHGLL
ncbi:MAG: hypothetical protein HQK87_06675 [Nitrospinae bacterium]|nr:hypothetical protein [Nitrospinota bacterium]